LKYWKHSLLKYNKGQILIWLREAEPLAKQGTTGRAQTPEQQIKNSVPG
jgi:hypothetical protein